MTKNPNVGKSSRTPAKHALMCSVYGSEVGIISNPKNPHHRDRTGHRWIDLTAGDGVTAEDRAWKYNCSPGINAYYATQCTKPVNVTLYEIKPATFGRLLNSLAQHLPSLGYAQLADTLWVYGETVTLQVVLGSGAEAPVSHIRPTDAVLVSNDPNAISDWAMRPTFAAEIAERTWCYRSISTMGCNVGGLLRAGFEAVRAQWFDYVEEQVSALPAWRDGLLAGIDGDSSKWGYLLCEPVKWRRKVERVIGTAFNKYGYDMKMAWHGEDPVGFEARMADLFLTRQERDAFRRQESGA